MSRLFEDCESKELPIPELSPRDEGKNCEPLLRGPITPPQPESPDPPPLTQEESELLDARAFSHRATGKTYRQIARLLDIPSSSAYKRVQREIGRRREEFAENEADSRELIVALLDGALEAIATQAYDGDQKAFHLLLQYANTRVRLAKIENPKTPDKLIRKLNAAAQGLLEETNEMAQPAQPPSPAAPQESVLAHPVECEQEQDREQRCGQKCGQEPQTLAETPVAADEKICAEHIGASNEKVNSCEASPHELPRSAYNNPAMGPADGNPRPSGGSLTNGAIRDESSAPQEGLRQYAAAFLQPTTSSPPALFAAPPEPRYA